MNNELHSLVKEMHLKDAKRKNHIMNKISKILKNGYGNIDESDEYKATSLHYATIYENIELIKLLLEYGANPNAQDAQGKRTPLHMAIMCDNKDIARLLVEYGADPSLKDLTYATPITLINQSNKITYAFADEMEELYENFKLKSSMISHKSGTLKI